MNSPDMIAGKKIFEALMSGKTNGDVSIIENLNPVDPDRHSKVAAYLLYCWEEGIKPEYFERVYEVMETHREFKKSDLLLEQLGYGFLIDMAMMVYKKGLK